MKRDLLLLAFLLVLLATVESCETICEFLYNNPDWADHQSKDDTFFEVTVGKGNVTGVITASFDIFSPEYAGGFDFLRFYAHTDKSLGENKSPLVLRTEYKTSDSKTSIQILGKDASSHQVGVKTVEVDGKLADIQISDLSALYYTFYFGDPGNASMFMYKFFPTLEWDRFQEEELRLRDTVRLKNDGKFTVYKYISSCSDPTPRLCDAEETVIVKLDDMKIGSSLTLTCSGYGAPYLDVKWTKDREVLTDMNPNNIYTDTEADHKVVSTITLSNVSIQHLGIWTCTISNKNFGDSVTRTYTLQYTSPVNIIGPLDSDHYKISDTETKYQWLVKGWPLEQVKLDCGSVGRVTRDESGYTTSIPPQITLTLTLRSKQDVVDCALKDGDKVVDTQQITRVGYICAAGQRGVRKLCVECPAGYTSLAGFGECFPDIINSDGGGNEDRNHFSDAFILKLSKVRHVQFDSFTILVNSDRLHSNMEPYYQRNKLEKRSYFKLKNYNKLF